MIESLLATRRIEFLDWDNTLLGVLVIPAYIRNYPRPGKDEIAAEHQRKLAEFRKNYPRQNYYVEERFCPVVRNGKIVVEHSLEFLPRDYVATKRVFSGFRTPKEE